MVMRISAKLNIFLGVPNLTDELLPPRLSYLKSYFRKRRFNVLFPISILSATFVAIALGQKIFGKEGAEAAGSALLFTLISLAILEHFFMMLPLPDAALWGWAMPANASRRTIRNSLR
jgi:putative photosynthetic complex assembly protein 2